MTPAPAGSEPGGFEIGPELWLLVLGVLATMIVLGISLWLVRRMIQEDREAKSQQGAEHTQSQGAPQEGDQ